MKLLLGKPRGFCAGVDRAIDIVLLSLKIFDHPIYVKHAIVHNEYVTNQLQKKGVKFIENINEVPDNSVIIFSAHGSTVDDYNKAKKKNLYIIDAVCPLVAKVHIEAKKFSQEGYKIILIGNKNHIEVIGIYSEAPNDIIIVKTRDEIKNLRLGKKTKIAVLTQTTLSVDDTKGIKAKIKKRYPGAIFPPLSDICYATTNRQKVVKKIAKKSDIVIVVGSITSSNTNRLVEVAKTEGVLAYRVSAPDEIISNWFNKVKNIGIISGASVPEELTTMIIKRLKKLGVDLKEEVIVADENKLFNLPVDIKKLAIKKGVGQKIIQKHNIF